MRSTDIVKFEVSKQIQCLCCEGPSVEILRGKLMFYYTPAEDVVPVTSVEVSYNSGEYNTVQIIHKVGTIIFFLCVNLF